VPSKPPTVVELVWDHDLVLKGSSGGIALTLDSAGVEGPSPMQSLGSALAACMAMDVVHILRKGRHDLRGLKARLSGHRATGDPHRFVSVDLVFTVTGDVPREPIQRAIDLSREKYCSVWHSLRNDIDFHITFRASR
jgi:putative redox protein